MNRPGAIATGSRLGPYTVRHPIGRGATAAVYAAEHDDGRVHAVKVRRRSQSPLDRRFLREFESMRLLRLPGVVSVQEAGLDDEWLWFSMDLVDGRDFLEAVHEAADLHGRVQRAITWGTSLCETLSALHQTGYVHRDVKPSNVLVDRDANLRVLDFGIGRFFNEAETLSRSGEVVGTLPFMAPEHLAGLPSTEHSDMFAVGLMLHEAIAGRRPKPLTTVGWIPRICLHRLPPLAILHREVPLGLSRLVERLCAVDPQERPSAANAAQLLETVAVGHAHPEWPDPPFCDPGDWWAPVEATIGHVEGRRVSVLEGPAGSGRSRIAEQVHRHGLLQGIWTVHLRCRIDEVGGPIRQLLDLLVGHLDEAVLSEVIGEEARYLRQLWPHLPLPTAGQEHTSTASTGRIVEAIGDVVERLSRDQPLLLVVHELERIDVLTSRTIGAIARRTGSGLGMILLHEARWKTARSRKLVQSLQERELADVIQVPQLTEETATAIAMAVCPHTESRVPAGATPQRANEVGLQALAQWRGEPLPPPEASLWPLSVIATPIPYLVFRALAGRHAAEGGWVHRTRTTASAAGSTALGLARSRVSSLRKSAETLAKTWSRVLGDDARPTDLAPLWLLAGSERQAWLPAARAAIEYDRRGMYGEARKWLVLLETIPGPDRTDELSFALAYARARVALRTDAVTLRHELVDAVEELARTPQQDQAVDILRAEYAQRSGKPRTALVTALHVAAATGSAAPHIALQALIMAIRARLVLEQPDEASRDLQRAETLRDKLVDPDPLVVVQIANLKAELLFHRDELSACRALCEENVKAAARARYPRGEAIAAARLGEVLRQLGQRRDAEVRLRAAREVFHETGDVYLDAATGVSLATLLCERGDALGARHLLDQTIRRIRGLNLEHLLPAALRLGLQVATLRSDGPDGAMALAAVEALATRDPETPSVLVRWWRSHGDVERALRIQAPHQEFTFGSVLWRLERARAALVGRRNETVLSEATEALEAARSLGFAELEAYASLILGVVDDRPDDAWTKLMRTASQSLYTEVFLGALELDARRLAERGDHRAARSRWMALAARSRELGYRPGVEEAGGWLEQEGQ